MNVGALRRGDWNPSSAAYDSLATGRVRGRDVWIRVPWMQIGVVDPSSHRALVPFSRGGTSRATTVAARSIGLRVVPARGASASATLAWDGWNVVRATERLKAGHEVFVDALREVSGPTPPA